MELEARFRQIVRAWSQDTDQINIQWQELQKHYKEDFRAYHNLSHLTELFRYFDLHIAALERPNEVAYAIFYHDIIYSIYSKRNELYSAELAIEYLQKLKVDDVAIERIFNLIMATKNHLPNGNPDANWMIDFDLGILGQPWEVYENYIKNIRQEYSLVPDFLFHKGRKKVLLHFLDKKRIYQTETFYATQEAIARENLKKELQAL